MKNERLLREYVRESLKVGGLVKEAITAGDLKYAMKLIKRDRNFEKAEEVARSLGKKGVVALLNYISAGAAAPAFIAMAANAGAINAGSAADDFYKTAKSASAQEKSKNKLFKFLSIDDDTTAIVDDKLEDEFEKEFIDRLKYYSDDDELPDADKAFNSWLKGKFNQSHVTKE